MSIKIGLIEFGHENRDLKIPKLCYIFNGVQNIYQFYQEEKIFIDENKTNWTRQEILNLVQEKFIMESRDLFFIIHEFEDDQFYFATNLFGKIALCTTHGWKNISTEIDVLYSLGSSIIQIIQYYEIYKDEPYKASQEYMEILSAEGKDTNLFHLASRGCLNDFCKNKKEKIFRIRTGDVCDECLAIWKEKNIGSEKTDALFELIEAVRVRTVVNKARIKLRAYCREQIAFIEQGLHQKLVQQLKEKYKKDWWIKGIPENVRTNAATRYEHHKCIGEKVDYTNLLDLPKIWMNKLNYSWLKLKNPFNCFPDNKNKIEDLFGKLNDIRNLLMHATREFNPTKEDKEFVDEIAKKIFKTS